MSVSEGVFFFTSDLIFLCVSQRERDNKEKFLLHQKCFITSDTHNTVLYQSIHPDYPETECKIGSITMNMSQDVKQKSRSSWRPILPRHLERTSKSNTWTIWQQASHYQFQGPKDHGWVHGCSQESGHCSSHYKGWTQGISPWADCWWRSRNCMAYFLISLYKPFRFIERPSFRRLLYYLNPKVKDTDIPKWTCLSDAVMHKIECLNDIDITLVAVSQTILVLSYKWLIWYQNILSLVLIVWDGWSSKHRCPFSSYSIQYINSSPNDPYDWSLKSHLIAFNWTVGQHTGQMVGKDLVGVVERFGLKSKVRLCFVYMPLNSYLSS